MTHPEDFIARYWCEAADLNTAVLLPFEGIMVPVPANYDKILTNMYGNYMAFPPVEQRGQWHTGELYLDPDIPYTEYFKNKYNQS